MATPEHFSMALPRHHQSAIAHSSLSPTAVNYEQWDVLAIGDINFPIIEDSVSIKNATRISDFDLGKVSLAHFYDSLLP